MHPKFKQLIARGYWAPAGDDGSDTGGAGTVDRGDDFKSPLDTAGKGDKLDDKPEDKGDKPEDKGDKPEDKDGEETEEEKAEREAAEAAEAAKRRIRIPKARFDEVQTKARAREAALLAEIDKLKGGQQATATQKAVGEMRTKIEELQDKYEDLILDGKKDEARKVRRQVDGMREELVEYQTSVKSDAARRSAVEELTYNAQLAGYEAQYPALNPEHDDFDPDKTDEVAALLNAFVKDGNKRADALKKAVKYALGAPPEAKGPSSAAATVAEQRAADARKKAADASKRQPADSKGVGKDSDKAGAGENSAGIDIMRVGQDKFAKLDEDTLSKLRGDEI